MASAQNFNPDVYREMKRIIEEIREGHPSKLPAAIASISETAQKNGLPLIIKNCESASAGVDSFVKVTDNLLELCESYCAQAKAFFDSFDVEY